MSKPRKKQQPIIPFLVALGLIALIFYVKSEPEAPAQEEEEMTMTTLSLPEDKILEFVVDKVTDVMRLFPQKGQSN